MSTKMIVLMSSDGKRFEIEEAIARQCQRIALMIDEDSFADEDKDYVLDVESKMLALVIEYCKKHHVDDAKPSSDEDLKKWKENLKKWDKQFIMKIDRSTVFGLIVAVKYLNIKSLSDLILQTITDFMTLTDETIKDEILSISTPEEVEAILKGIIKD